MLKPSDALDDIYQKFTALRARFDTEIAKLEAELDRPSRNRIAIINATHAAIEAAMRDYQVFMTHVNALRLKEEAQAETHQDMINKRREWGAATAQTNLFRSEINRWHEVKGLVLQQVKQRRQKLYADETKLPATVTAQLLASDEVFKWLHVALNGAQQSEEAIQRSCFPDIGLPNSDFLAHLHAAYRLCLALKRTKGVRFLDVGCGGGLKVYSALRYFEDAQGFDLEPAYVEASERLFSLDPTAKATVFKQDALTFEGYDAFDVIYFYRPISDDAVLHQLEERITSMARPETVLIAPYITFPERFESLGCGRVSGAVYLAQTSQKKADAYRRLAERIGSFVPQPDPPAPHSIWTPLIEASRANGYDFPHRHKKARY